MRHISGSVLFFAVGFLFSIFFLSVWPKRNTSPRFYLQLWISRVAHTNWAGGVWRGPTWEANRWWDEKKKKIKGWWCPVFTVGAGQSCSNAPHLGRFAPLFGWWGPAAEASALASGWPLTSFPLLSSLLLAFILNINFLFQLCAFPLPPPPPEHTLNNLFCERHLNHEADDDKPLYLCRRRQMFSTRSSLVSPVAAGRPSSL